MTELINLLNDIAMDIEFHCYIVEFDDIGMRKKADDYFVRFKEIYARIDRHRYSGVTKYIDSQLPDTVDSLRDGMSKIIFCAESNQYDSDTEDPTNQECYKKINKLYDHIELEAARYSSIKKIQLIAADHNKQKEDIQELLKETKTTVGEMQDRATHLSQQLISILGIFAGIVVTFSFATTIAGDAIANSTKDNVIYVGFLISVFGAVFMNVIAFLMSFVTKLSGHAFSKKFPWFLYVLGNLIAVGLSLFFFFEIQ